MEWQLDLSCELFCLVVNDDSRRERAAEPSWNTGRPFAALQWLSEDQVKDMREVTPMICYKRNHDFKDPIY